MNKKSLLLWGIHLYLLFSAIDHVDTHYVVFEEVGQLAASVAYLHVTIPLNLSAVSEQVTEYRKLLTKTVSFTQYQHDWHTGMWHQIYFDERLVKIMEKMEKEFRAMASELVAQGDRMQSRFAHLKTIMPLVSSSPTSFQTSELRVKRALPALPLLLLKGIFGTIHGLYTRRQYKQLKTELHGVIKEQKRLIELIREQTISNLNLTDTQQHLMKLLGDFNLVTPARILATVKGLEQLIDQELDRIYDAVQQAQSRRLSVTLLSGQQLDALFNGIKARADTLGTELLLERPSDLFQIELSYAFDGEDITLVLHVPMTSKRSKLRLMKFLPFPLSFSATHFLIPRPTHVLFAISSDEPRLYLELDEADLEGCYRIGSTHLCERMGILSNVLETSCLGSMYAQKFQQSMSSCIMDVVPLSETVLQLEDNWFLIYATTSFTGYVTCRNSSSSEHHLKMGVNKLPLSPSCSLRLQNHVIFADSSLQTSSQFKEFQWNLDDVTFSAEEVSEAEEVLSQVAEEGANRPTLAEVRAHSAQNKRSPKWLYFFILVGIICFIFLAVGVVCFVSRHKILLLKKSLKLLRQSISIVNNRLWPPREGTEAIYEEVPLQPVDHPESGSEASFQPPPPPRRRRSRDTPRHERPHRSESRITTAVIHAASSAAHAASATVDRLAPPRHARSHHRRSRSQPEDLPYEVVRKRRADFCD